MAIVWIEGQVKELDAFTRRLQITDYKMAPKELVHGRQLNQLWPLAVFYPFTS
jgi:hypothetical protein